MSHTSTFSTHLRSLSDDCSADPLPSAVGTPPRAGTWTIVGVALVVAAAFFFAEHSLDISLADAYTQTAEEMELAAGGGNTARRLTFLVLAAVGGVLLIGPHGSRLSIHWPLAAAIGAYLALCAASILWSIDPGMCLRRVMVLGCCAIFAAGLARRFTMHELCLVVVATIGPLVLVGLLAELRLGTFRPWSAGYRFSGSVHPNTQGMHLTMLGLAAWALARTPATKHRGFFWTIFAATLVLGILTKSRTGNAATLLAIGSVLVVHTSARWKLSVGFACIWLGLVGLWLLLLAGFDPLVDFRDTLLLGRTEQSDTLSGRAYIWPVVMQYIGQRPWLGYGYESFWNPAHIDTISSELEWGLREAHNGYLEVLLSTGAIGLVLASAAVLAGLVTAAKGLVAGRDPAYGLALGMLVFGVFSSTMESGLVVVMLPPVLIGALLLKMALFAEGLPAPESHSHESATYKPHSNHPPVLENQPTGIAL
jgi:exopolysaccharide production protein ExoQ